MIQVAGGNAIIWAALIYAYLTPARGQDAPGAPDPLQNPPTDALGIGGPPAGPDSPSSATQAPISPVGTNAAGNTGHPPDSVPPTGLLGPQGQAAPGGPGQIAAGVDASGASAGTSVPGAPKSSAPGNPQAAGSVAGAAGPGGAQAGSALQRLTEFRSRHRKTLDGRLCAAAFVHEGQTYTDCTDARSPDGTTGTLSSLTRLFLQTRSTRRQAESGVTSKFNCLGRVRRIGSFVCPP